MTALDLSAALVAPAVARTLLAPTFLGVAATAVVLTLLLYAERPQLTRRTIVALVPWMVVGAALSVLAGRTTYPANVEPAVTGVGAYVTTYAVVCLVWFVLLQFARGARRRGGLPNYLGAMGVGAGMVLVSALIVSAGDLAIAGVFWLAMAPIAAAAVAAVVVVMLGLWYTEAAAYTGVVGGLVVFGHALAAIATALAVASGGGHTVLSWTVMDLLSTLDAPSLVGLDRQLLWAWGFVWTKLVIATGAVVGLSAYAHRHPSRGNLLLGLFAAAGIVAGVTSLLAFAVGA